MCIKTLTMIPQNWSDLLHLWYLAPYTGTLSLTSGYRHTFVQRIYYETSCNMGKCNLSHSGTYQEDMLKMKNWMIVIILTMIGCIWSLNTLLRYLWQWQNEWNWYNANHFYWSEDTHSRNWTYLVQDCWVYIHDDKNFNTKGAT